MKVAAIQMVSGADLGDNLTHAGRLIAQATQAGAELVVLPEYFCLMGLHDTDKLNIQEPLGAGRIQQFLSDAARQHRIWLVGGTLPLCTEHRDKVTNTSLVFNPHGECVARYDKIHLFCYNNGRESYDESRVLRPGSTPTLFALPDRAGHIWSVGLSVCYDLRFPELYRWYAQGGADLLLVPSAFTSTTGAAHWEVLLRARAIENLAYVVAAAQGGVHSNGRSTWGHSMVIDPWGQPMAQHEQQAGWVLVELQSARLQECRQQLPALGHRVLGI
jgi:deaminated glutathione amidase